MGNCVRRQSSMQWEDEEWDLDPPKGSNMHVQEYYNETKVEKIVENLEKTTCTAAATEVKIKITKKQLEELLGRVKVKELSVEQVLVQLMNASSQFDRHHQQGWKPALQSIPE